MEKIKLFRKKLLTPAIELTEDNLEMIKAFGVSVLPYYERSRDSFIDNAKLGSCVVWTDFHSGKIKLVMAKTLEGMHTAQNGTMIMRGAEGEFYFCDKSIFDKTYEETGQKYDFIELKNISKKIENDKTPHR